MIATRIQMNRIFGQWGVRKRERGEEGERGKKRKGRKRRAGEGREQGKGNFTAA